MDTPANTILDLNDKTLSHIFSYLRLEDKLKLTLICERFSSFTQNTISNEMVDISLIQINFTLDEAKHILTECGNFIKRIRFASSFENSENLEYAKLILDYCPNLEEIFFFGFEITVDNVQGQLLAVSKNVKILKLKKCTLGNAACYLLQGLRELKSLNLEDSKLTGKGFNKFTKLVHLNLKNCRNFKCKNFIDICKSNKLKTLNITGFKQITCGALSNFIETQSKLEVLGLGDKYWFKNHERLCRVANVKEVSMVACYEKTVLNYIKELKTHRKDALECIEVNLPIIFTENSDMYPEIVSGFCAFENLRAFSFRNCMLFENTDLVRIGKSCRKLEMLDLYGSSFTDLGIIGYLEYSRELRHLDISHCEVKRSLYKRLLGIRRKQNCGLVLNVYIQPKMEIAKILESEDYYEHENVVRLTTDSMRTASDVCILNRLEYLNDRQIIKPIFKIATCHTPPSHLSSPYSSLLLNLNDDCLYQIVKHLGLVDQLTLVLTNERFDPVLKFFLRTELFDIVKVMANFTLREARVIFSRCGRILRRLVIQPSAFHFDIDYYNLALEYCTNIEEIHFYNIHMDECIKLGNDMILSSAKTLKILKTQYWDMNDAVTLSISKATKLETLFLTSTSITGQHLIELKGLIKLDLGKCKDLDAKYFTQICEMNRLKELDIRGCHKLDGVSFKTLVETQDDLERITLGGMYAATNMYTVARLKNLIDISLRKCIPQEIIELLNELSEKRRNEIQYLTIKCSGELTATLLPTFRDTILEFPNLIYLRLPSCSMVDNEYVKRIAKACLRLEIFDVHSTDNLNDEGIIEVVGLLKHLRHFDVKFCGFNNLMVIYNRCIDIKKRRNDSFPLTLYIQTDGVSLEHLIETKESKVMEKYVILSNDWIHNIDKSKYYLKRMRNETKEIIVPAEHDLYSTSTHPSILRLPTNCLLKIASPLNTIDKLKFAMIHKKIRESVRTLLDNLLIDVNEISLHFTKSEIEQLLSDCGPNIRRLQFAMSHSSNPVDYLKLFQPYSEYLREICVNGAFESNMNEIGKIFSAPSQQLEKLSLKNCYPLDPVLSEILNKKSDYNNPFENLIELHLFECGTLRPTEFAEFCQNCQLKRLDIRGCKLLRSEEFTLLVTTQCDSLEWLGVSCEYYADNIGDVALLENLKHITIDLYTYTPTIEIILDKLVKYRRNDLISLEITDKAHRTVDYCLMSQLVEERCKRFTKLKKVEINYPKPYIKPYQYE